MGKTCSLVLACLVLAKAGNGQNSSPNHIDTGAKKMLASADTEFAIRVAQGAAAEIQMGKLATQKAGDPALKAFGQQMIDDYTTASDRLKAIAREERMTLPDSMSAKEQARYDKLNALTGPAFDKAYLAAMVKEHEMERKQFRKEAESGQDPAIKNFAAQTLPIVQGHLEKAMSLSSKAVQTATSGRQVSQSGSSSTANRKFPPFNTGAQNL